MPTETMGLLLLKCTNEIVPCTETSLLYRCGQQTVLFRFLNLFCIQEVLFYSLYVTIVLFTLCCYVTIYCSVPHTDFTPLDGGSSKY